MSPHSVVDPTHVHHPADLAAIVLFAAVAVACTLATARRPGSGVALLLALTPFAFVHDAGPTTLSLPKFALLGLLAGLALRRIDPRPALSGSARPLVLGAAALVAANALTLCVAQDRGAAVREIFKACEYGLALTASLVALRDDPSDALPLLRIALFGSVGCVAALALAELWTGAPSGFWVGETPLPRIAGPLEGPNQLAGYLGVVLPVASAIAAARRARAAELLALFLGGAALVLTVSRAGIVTTLLALVVVLVACRRLSSTARDATGAVGAATALGVLTGVCGIAWEGATLLQGTGGAWLALSRLWSTHGDPHHGGVGTRGELWHAAYALWRRSPLLGIGAGNFEGEIALVGPHGVRTHANDVYVQALVEGGLPLFAATILTLALPIVRFARRCAADPVACGVVAATAALALHEVVDDLTFFPKVGETWWILLAVAARDRPGSENAAKR